MQHVKNIYGTSKYDEWMSEYLYVLDERFFKDEEELSLTTNYTVLIKSYIHSYDTGPRSSCSISAQVVMLRDNNGKVLFQAETIGRPFYTYILHSNGHEYFICGGGLSLFHKYDITSKTSVSFADECVADETCRSDFWYITDWIYNCNNNLIAINGLGTLNDSVVNICDFSDPDRLPLKVISFCRNGPKEIDDVCTANAWNDDNSLKVDVGEEYCRTINISEKEIIGLLNTT